MSQIPSTPASVGSSNAQASTASVANPAQSEGGESFLLALLGQLLGSAPEAPALPEQGDQAETRPGTEREDDKAAATSSSLPGNILPLPLNPPQLPAAQTPTSDTPDELSVAVSREAGKGGDSSQWLKMLQTLVQSAPKESAADSLAAPRTTPDLHVPSHDAPATAAGPVPGTAPPAPQPPASQPSVTVNLPVNHPQWSQDLGSKVTWLLGQGIQDAKLQLHPQHLGPVQVHISLNDNHAAVNFVAHHADTRDALQAALPQLRDMLQQSGIQLGQAQVSADQGGQAQAQADGRHAAGGPRPLAGAGAEEEGGASPTPMLRRLQGLFDDYA